jgi:CelD/BcsL family acetyltransferase involved in cellulose biosynthesis
VNGLQRVELTDARWASFVAAQSEATPFHTPAWAEMLCECYDFNGFALASLDEHGVPTAGMPVIELPRVFRRGVWWVSLPFTDACAPLSVGLDREQELLDGLDEARREARVERLEIRSPAPARGARQFTAALRHTLTLEPDPQAVLCRLDRSQVQRNIKRAEREGVVVRQADSEGDLDRVFFDLQVETRRRLGVPVQPRRFYTLLWRRLIEPGHGFLLLAYAGARPIAGGVFLRAGRTLTYKYGASSREHWHPRPNVLLFWTAIQLGCASGAQVLDFGRTELKAHGLRSFKLNWGTREELLRYTVFGRHGRDTVKMLEPVAGRLIKHSPSWVCRAVGACMYRYAS